MRTLTNGLARNGLAVPRAWTCRNVCKWDAAVERWRSSYSVGERAAVRVDVERLLGKALLPAEEGHLERGVGTRPDEPVRHERAVDVQRRARDGQHVDRPLPGVPHVHLAPPHHAHRTATDQSLFDAKRYGTIAVPVPKIEERRVEQQAPVTVCNGVTLRKERWGHPSAINKQCVTCFLTWFAICRVAGLLSACLRGAANSKGLVSSPPESLATGTPLLCVTPSAARASSGASTASTTTVLARILQLIMPGTL